SLHLVRLHGVLRHEAADERSVLLERGVDVAPRCLFGEHEVVQGGRELERRAPAELVEELIDPRVVREAAPQLFVERRAAVGRADLIEKRLAAQARSSADFAWLARAPKACGSLTA